MTITIDSRGCGEGKTTSAIYPKLQKHLQTHQRTLIVVPSVPLQDQYDSFLTDPIAVAKINSYEKASDTDKLSVIAKIKIAMENPAIYVIIITQAAFKLLDVSEARKTTWHLIIDEAFDPSCIIKYVRNKSQIDWGLCMRQADRPATSSYIPIEIDERYLDTFCYSEAIKSILDTKHWRSYVTPEGYEGLIQNTGNVVEVYQELNPELVLGWQSVHIAAAAFDTTPMAHWLNINNIAYTTPWPFVRRDDLPIVLHSINNFDWSKNRAQKYPEIADNFRRYVRDTCDELGIERIITLRNNSDLGTIDNEERINHNPHGLNHLTELTAISIESALNPSPGYKSFLKEHFGMEDAVGRRDITRAFSAYLFYQSIMRTAARLQGNTQVVHVFVLDNKSAFALTDYFEPLDVVDIPIEAVDRVTKTNGRPSINSRPMSAAERNKKWREKQKLQANESTISAISSFVSLDAKETPRLAPQTNEDKLKALLANIKAGL